MKVVMLCETYAEAMGYAGTCIPATMAKNQFVDVYYVTAGLPVYYRIEDFKQTYGNFQVSDHKPGDRRTVDDYTVVYVPFKPAYGGVRMYDLERVFADIRPDVIQTLAHTGWTPVDAARLQRKFGYRLFTGNHTTASVYPLANSRAGIFSLERVKEFVKRGLPGQFISSRMELCYGATKDCSDVAHRFFGVPAAKLKTVPLGVDTDIFHPVSSEEDRAQALELRQGLGVADDEILCVYTGRFAEDKNPVLLAQAVAALRSAGHRYRAVFFGEGVQRERIEAIEGTIVRPFVHFSKLGALYRAADIGVWPTQESTSMIDCAASGTPIIVNDTIAAVERVEGNGLRYRLNDLAALQSALLELRDEDRRRELGNYGARKMEESYSWNALVKIRLDDYRDALARHST